MIFDVKEIGAISYYLLVSVDDVIKKLCYLNLKYCYQKTGRGSAGRGSTGR